MEYYPETNTQLQISVSKLFSDRTANWEISYMKLIILSYWPALELLAPLCSWFVVTGQS